MANAHVLAYQSRVGPVEWLKPYTDDTLRKLGAERCKARTSLNPKSSLKPQTLRAIITLNLTYVSTPVLNLFTAIRRCWLCPSALCPSLSLIHI